MKPPAGKIKPEIEEEDDDEDEDEDDQNEGDDDEDNEDDEDDEDDDDNDDDDDDDEGEDDEVLQGSSDEDESGSEDEGDFGVEGLPKSAGKKRHRVGVKNAGSGKKQKVAPSTGAGKQGADAEYWQSLIALGQSRKGIGSARKTKETPTRTSMPKQTQQQATTKKTSTEETPGNEKASKGAAAFSKKNLGQFFCQPCNRSFQSKTALTQHNTAKHK